MEGVYVDACFIVYWFARKEPVIRKKVRVLLTRLISQKSEICISTLTLDEAWHGIKKEVRGNRARDLPHYHPDVFSLLKCSTDAVLKFPKTRIVQFIEPADGIRQALDNINDYEMKPRDAFHLAIMKDNKITQLITNDKHFISQQDEMGIQVMSV